MFDWRRVRKYLDGSDDNLIEFEGYVCPYCGKEIPLEVFDVLIPVNFCPNCGSSMKEKRYYYIDEVIDDVPIYRIERGE